MPFSHPLLSRLLFACGSLVCAQSAPERFSAAANLLGLATLNPTIDLEARVSGPVTVGCTAWWEVRDVKDRWIQARLAWYPRGIAMRGPGVALTAGWERAWKEKDDPAAIRGAESASTAGVLVSWDWRLGAGEALRLGIRSGARATIPAPDDHSPIEPVYAEARLDLGWVF